MSSLVLPPVPIHPRDDAIQLYHAFKGLGCDTTTVVNILTHRDATQRAMIQHEYGTLYGDLIKRLTSELGGNTKKGVLLWMHEPAARDAAIVRHALSGNMIDIQEATEVICSRTPTQIRTFRHIYYSQFSSLLEDDIEALTSGDHKKLLLAYIDTVRYEGPEFDQTLVEKDAKSLYKAGEKRLGTDEKVFIKIFSGRSRAHLAAVSAAYHRMYGSLKKAVKSETSGMFEFGLLTILRCAENSAKYFARELRKSMKGLGTDETTLTRIVVTRAEIDLQHIKAEYHKKYKKSLSDAISSETSGNYKHFLLSLVGPCH